MDLLNIENNLVDERIMRAVREMGFDQFSPIQQQAIPKMLEGLDVIGQAQTGTGKTAAFGIPVLQKMEPEISALQALILCPTRELAIQAAEEIRKFAKYMHGIKVLPVYGGQDMGRQIKALKGNPQIIVGTPGRVMDHMRRRTIKLDNLKMVVLDEADEMLDMGFREDMETILSQIPNEHQTVLFSATMPQSILNITGQFQKNPVLIKTIKKELTVSLIKQYYYEVRKENKVEVTSRLLDYYNPKLTLIFCNTKKMVEELAESLKGRGYLAEGIHGDLSQAQRDRVMAAFRNGSTDILIATDVAARGIDVDDVEAVINYDVPQDNEYYVHRIGRTGRAGRCGRAFTLVVGREIYKIREIEKICKTTMKAKAVPSPSDITNAKSNKVLASVLETMRNQDLSDAMRIIENKMEEEDCTAMELAAAFLKEQLGEQREEIELIDFEKEHARKWGKDLFSRRGNREGRERRDNREGKERRDNRERREGWGNRNSKRDGKFGEGRKSIIEDNAGESSKVRNNERRQRRLTREERDFEPRKNNDNADKRTSRYTDKHIDKHNDKFTDKHNDNNQQVRDQANGRRKKKIQLRFDGSIMEDRPRRKFGRK